MDFCFDPNTLTLYKISSDLTSCFYNIEKSHLALQNYLFIGFSLVSARYIQYCTDCRYVNLLEKKSLKMTVFHVLRKYYSIDIKLL